MPNHIARRQLARARRGVAPVLIAVIVVVVAVVAVVGGLFATGVLKFSSGGGGGSATTYAVTFSESGLPSGTSWSVTLNGGTSTSTTSTVAFTEANGTYSYTVGSVSGYTATPSSGSVTVNGAAISQPVAFTRLTTYSVVFSETGLASGTSWTVTLGGASLSSTTSTITFSEPNGSYLFVVTATGYSASPSSGTITVSGVATTQAIVFTAAATYTVTFTETGLGLGATWTATLNSVPENSTGTSIVFTGISAGSYAFSVSASGYSATPSGGTITVSQADVTQSITFSSGGGGSAQSYSQAEATAAAAAAGYSGGGWVPAVGIAVAISSAYAIASSALVGIVLGCTATWIGTQPATINIPATSGSAATGYSAAWLVLFGKASTGQVLMVTVISGTATLTYIAAGSNCAMLGQLSTAGLIDSPQAVASANTNGGSAFLATHTVALEQFMVQGNYEPYFAGSWGVDYSTCALSQNSGTGEEFTAEINGTTGAFIGGSTQATNCTSPSVSTYTVTFTETDLTAGASWSVTLNTVTQSSTGSSIVYSLVTNGTYNFSVTAAGYTATPSGGTISVSGADVAQAIAFTSGGGGGSSPIFSAAEATAESAASSYEGGGWTSGLAEALALPASISLTGSELAQFGTNCTITWVGTEPSQVTLPSTPSSAATGGSAAWMIFLTKSGSSGFLLVLVAGGTATLLYTGSGGICTTYAELSVAGLIDSPQAVTAANNVGGTAFLAAHPTGVSRAFLVFGTLSGYGGSFFGIWEVLYTTCGYSQSSGTGYQFNATINGTSGRVISSGSQSLTCSGGYVPANVAAGPLATTRGVPTPELLARAAERVR